MTETRVDEIDLLAERWGVSDIWRTTHAVVKSLFGGDARPLALRLWPRHLEAARGRTVAESHLAAWMSPFWAFPVAHALRCASTQIADDLRPVPGESWLTKLSRARLAIRDAGVRRSSHDCMLRDAQLATPPAFFLDRIERRREESSMSDQPRTREEST